jgi:hypothetical protein
LPCSNGIGWSGYTEDDRLRPDNNLGENAIRPVAPGRKNWLYSGHSNGAEPGASCFSLIETARRSSRSHMPVCATSFLSGGV